MACALSKTKKRPQNVKMLQRVMLKLKEEQHDNLDYTGTYYVERAAKYTGLQMGVLEDLRNTQSYQVEFKEIDRAVIYEALTSFYLDKNIIPTTRQLFEALYKKIPAYVDISSFRKTLVKMGFVWKRVRGYDVVVIEKPTVIFERYQYLKNIINYREEDKPVYFIEENAKDFNQDYYSMEESIKLSKNNPDVFQQRFIYAVSKKGIHSVKYVHNFDKDTFTKWLTNDFLPTLEEKSVVVFNQAKHHCEQIIEPPNKESLKLEICNWLEYHSVPFDPEMSKYELLTLTEKCTDIDENMYVIDRILKESGHIPLRIPDCIKKLTPASLLCNLIKINRSQLFPSDVCSEAIFVEALHSIPKEKIAKYDEYISNHETDIFLKDTKIDLIYDDLMNKMMHMPMTGEADSDIPSCSDSD